MTQVYVVCWRYLDNAGFGVIKGFYDESKALDFRDLMQRHGDENKEYVVLPAPFEDCAYG